MSTQLLNAYTFLIPEGEHFIARTCRRYLGQVTLELRSELESLFFQEGSHSREHQHVLENMDASGMGLPLFRKLVFWISYRLVEPAAPVRLRLATAAAIEHHNAIIARHFLEQDLLRGIRDPELRRLFLWHFAEELEHKETVFKLLEAVSRSWCLRAAGLLFSLGTFLLYWFIGTLLLGVRTRAALNTRFWTELVWQCFSVQGLMIGLTRESIRYLRPDFCPSLQETAGLLSSSLKELKRIGIECPVQNQPVKPRALPPKYQSRVRKTLERCDGMRLTYPFFFDCIEEYENAWVRSGGERKLNFCTYSYLGLERHPRILNAAQKALEHYGTGSHGVRLLGGNLDLHEALEERIASFVFREAAITFSSGFMANLAVISTLVGRGDYVLTDELTHASVVDGCRLSRANVVRFGHNDTTELNIKLERLPSAARKLIVVDAVYSMDGDIAPLPKLIGIRNRSENTLVMVDEAHSLGVLGQRGRGIEEHFDCPGQVDVLMGTLSKTIPAQGGYVAGSHDLIRYLRYNARGFVFSAALCPVATAGAHEALEVIEQEGQERRGRLMGNVRYFIGRLRREGFELGDCESAIVPVLMGSESRAFDMAKVCHGEGIYAMPVVYPAVPRGTERLRLNVTCEHRRDELDFAVAALVRARTILDRGAGCR